MRTLFSARFLERTLFARTLFFIPYKSCLPVKFIFYHSVCFPVGVFLRHRKYQWTEFEIGYGVVYCIHAVNMLGCAIESLVNKLKGRQLQIENTQVFNLVLPTPYLNIVPTSISSRGTSHVKLPLLKFGWNRKPLRLKRKCQVSFKIHDSDRPVELFKSVP